MSQRYNIEPITAADAPALALLDIKSYEGEPMREYISAYSTSPPTLQTQHLQWQENILRQQLATDKKTNLLKAVTEHGDIIGWGELKQPGFASPLPDENNANGKEKERQDFGPPPCFRMKRVAEYMTGWQAARIKVMGERDDYWCVAKLDIHPDHLDASDAMLAHMISLSGNGKEIYFASPPGSVNLALRHGFEIRDRVPFLDGSWVLSVMTRRVAA